MTGPSPPRLAVCLRNFVTTGGAERYAIEVSRRLAAHFEVHVFAQRWEKDLEGVFQFHRLPAWPRKPRWLNLALFDRRTARLTRQGFDLVHGYDRATHGHLVTIQCGCHRDLFNQPATWPQRTARRLATDLSPRHRLYLSMEREQFEGDADRLIVAASELVKTGILRHYRVTPERFAIAHSGVDAAGLQSRLVKLDRSALRARNGLAEGQMAILFVGSDFRRKGLDTLLEALARTRLSWGRLWVVGGGPRHRYEPRVRQLGLENRVVFTGLAANPLEYYAMADLFVLPTRHDPCSLSTLEAMAAGLPVVMSGPRQDGTAELVRAGEAVLLEDPSDADALAEVLYEMRDSQRRLEMAARGRRLADRQTWDRPATVALEVCQDILRKRASSHPATRFLLD